MILQNGVVRTLEPSLPTAGALAIAGDRVAGGVGVHETALASPETVDLGGRCVVPGFTDSHVHFPTWAVAQHEVNLDGCSSLDEALDRVRAAEASLPPGRPLRGYGWRDGDWTDAREPTRQDLDAVTGDRPAALIAKDYHSLWLNSAALALAGRRSRRRRRRRRARRDGRADGRAPRGVGVAVQGAPPAHPRRRVRRGDARRREARERARRHLRPRQGRLARRRRALAAARRAQRALAPGLAVGPARQAAGAAVALAPQRLRLAAPPRRLPEGLHGRDARLADRVDAGRQRRRDHERRGARGDRPRGRRGGLARRRARDRRPRQPRGARRVRADARRLGAARAAAADRARAVPRAGGHPALRRARRRRLVPVHARDLRPRPRRAVLAGQAGRDVRVPLAARHRRGRRERLRRADRGARPVGRRRRRRAPHDATSARPGGRSRR